MNDNRPNHGTRTCQFAEVTCKKDVCKIQAKLAPSVNSAKETLENSKLVCVRNENGLKTFFIPKNSTTLSTFTQEQIIYLQYQSNGESISRNTKLSDSGQCIIWTVITNMKMIVAGDLSFFATSMGRDGRSNCRCPYCD